MEITKFAEIISLIHEAFFEEKLTIKKTGNIIYLTNNKETFSVDNIVKTRIRITFPDYVGKIDIFRDFFGFIMKNNDNLCDTSDFIDLSISHAIKISGVVDNIDMYEIKNYKDL
ncbi:hypothetical protein [Acholeplasma granularum]|uniref:hypothetical protein n=1 Tax=Acholeplasma granularum TaxID=264635 RepID=UPI00047083F9|nr:hypothetical protein [Acholeplasma granularum]